MKRPNLEASEKNRRSGDPVLTYAKTRSQQGNMTERPCLFVFLRLPEGYELSPDAARPERQGKSRLRPATEL